MSEGVFASFAIRIRPLRQGEVRLVGREAQILLLLLLPLPLLLFLPLPTVAAAAAAALPFATPAATTAGAVASTALIVKHDGFSLRQNLCHSFSPRMPSEDQFPSHVPIDLPSSRNPSRLIYI